MFLIKRSLFVKILLSMLAATTIPFFISNTLSSQIIGRSVKDQLVELNQNSMSITLSNIHKYVHDISLLTTSYYGDQELIRLLYKEVPHTPAETVYMRNRLERIYSSYTEIGHILYWSALTNKTMTVRSDVNERIPLPAPDQRSDASQSFDFLYSVVSFDGVSRLMIQKDLIDIPARQPIGTTTLVLRNTGLKALADPLAASTEASDVYLLMQNDLQLLYASPEAHTEAMEWIERLRIEPMNAEGISKGVVHDARGIYIYYRDVSYGLPLTLVKFIPQSVIAQTGKQALSQSLALQIGAIGFVAIMAAFISYFILIRVKRIFRHIKSVQMGNFNIRADAQGTYENGMDELGLLEQKFQEMVEELDHLWNRQYRYRLELSNARLKMLQAQINPHFFYNTLQSISTLAIKKQAPEVSDKLSELGAMFRYSMDIDTEEVRLHDELNHLQHYISLQLGRYADKLKFFVHCPDEAMSFIVPKMILQPLVENSIIHGIHKGRGTGTIRIDIAVDEKLSIRITDDGRGFQPGEIAAIRKAYADSLAVHDSRSGIGLMNVLKRLQLYFGDHFSWEIESEPEVRTCIMLHIPMDTRSVSR